MLVQLLADRGLYGLAQGGILQWLLVLIGNEKYVLDPLSQRLDLGRLQHDIKVDKDPANTGQQPGAVGTGNLQHGEVLDRVETHRGFCGNRERPHLARGASLDDGWLLAGLRQALSQLLSNMPQALAVLGD